MNTCVIFLLVVLSLLTISKAAGTRKFSIECEHDKTRPLRLRSRSPQTKTLRSSRTKELSLCDCIKKALPEMIEDGRITLSGGNDMALEADTQYMVAVPPPNDFVPYSRADENDQHEVIEEEETSIEKFEKLKSGVAKMSHIVNVLGLVDQYLTDRSKTIVHKLTKLYED